MKNYCFRMNGIVVAVGIILGMTFAPPAFAKLRVVTTTTDLGDVARAIGGNRVRVDTFCRGHQDPHFLQARPSYMVTLSRADLLIAVGLELEVGWLPLLIQGARNPKINPGNSGYLETANAIVPIEVPTGPVDRSQGDVHPSGNPHYLLNPDNAKRVAAAVAVRLTELDGDGVDVFHTNLARWNARLDAAIRRWRERMDAYRGTKVSSVHATYNYFFDFFGLTAVGYIEERPGIPPGPAHLSRIVKTIRDQKVRVIFHDNYYSRSHSDFVAARTGARVLELPTMVGGVKEAPSYVALLDVMISRFVEAMAGER